MSFPSELEAFRAYVTAYPDAPTLLVDTYDTLESGVPNAIRAFQEARAQGLNVTPSIRLDSGDLAILSIGAWKQFVEAGFPDVQIVASSDLEEDLIADIKRQGAKINAWGVGTHLIVSKDHPALGGVYKLVAVADDSGAWKSKLKVSSNPEKTTNPGRKQVVRCFDEQGSPLADVLLGRDETLPRGPVVEAFDAVRLHERVRLKGVARVEPLMIDVVRSGDVVHRDLNAMGLRARARHQIAHLPLEYQRLRNPHVYRVLLSPALTELKRALLSEVQA
mgnify:CR=1 FL=1